MILVRTISDNFYVGEPKVISGNIVVLTNARCIYPNSSKVSPYELASSFNPKGVISEVADEVEVRYVTTTTSFPNEALIDKFPRISVAGRASFKKLCLGKFNGLKVIDVDGYAVVVTQEHGRFKRGYLLKKDLTHEDGYVITFGTCSAFGKNLHEAFASVQRQVLHYQTTKVGMVNFVDLIVRKYPDVDAPIPCLELVLIHNLLTNSCTTGINEFCAQHNIDFHKEYSMRDLIELTKDAYSPEVMQKLADKYNLSLQETNDNV